MKNYDAIQQSSADSDIAKCTLVGDSCTGKSNLLLSYASNQFITEYVPTVFEHYSCEVQVRGKSVYLEVWDLSANEEHKSLRDFAYSKTDAALVVFSLTDY